MGCCFMRKQEKRQMKRFGIGENRTAAIELLATATMLGLQVQQQVPKSTKLLPENWEANKKMFVDKKRKSRGKKNELYKEGATELVF